MNTKSNKISPFSDNPIMIGYDNRLFDFDYELGYVFPGNKLVDTNDFVSLDEKVAELKNRKGKFLVLNIGDSSTSGWNSNEVFKGCADPYAALFSYKTYSDFLKEKYDVDVINAGVPGHTSYQAKKYLGRILKKLSQNNIYVDYVTIYLGNNDCTYNGSEDKVRIDYKIPSKNEVLVRVSKDDFIENYKEAIKTIVAYGAQPIILLPASNYKWQPGLRSQKFPDELVQQYQKIHNSKIKKLFDEAERNYQFGDYKTAIEKDLLLPRIKNDYKKSLNDFAVGYYAPVINVQSYVKNENDFIDYCHPDEHLNGAIAKAINNKLKDKNNFCKSKPIELDLPLDTYSLY